MPNSLNALGIGNCLDVLIQPLRELVPVHLPRRQCHHHLFLFVESGVDFSAVEKKKGSHRGMPSPLVAVDEWMTLNDRETEDSRLVSERLIQVLRIKGRFGEGGGRLQRSELSNPPRPTRGIGYYQVKVHDLGEREVAH